MSWDCQSSRIPFSCSLTNWIQNCYKTIAFPQAFCFLKLVFSSVAHPPQPIELALSRVPIPAHSLNFHTGNIKSMMVVFERSATIATALPGEVMSSIATVLMTRVTTTTPVPCQ